MKTIDKYFPEWIRIIACLIIFQILLIKTFDYFVKQ